MVAAPFSPLGSLADFDNRDETLHIGTRFPSSSTQLSAFLSAPNSKELITDLASLVAHRGVVFFTDQDLNLGEQTRLADLLGQYSGRPETSTLHRHPISEDTSETSAEVSVIDSKGGISRANEVKHARASRGWHADITFEHVPADYSLLKMHTIPDVGGDTLWASGYEAYDRLSPAFARFLEGLTAVHNADFFVDYARRTGIPIQDPRGSPENTGSDLTAVHPVIRTHPVTGFKTLFVNRTIVHAIFVTRTDDFLAMSMTGILEASISLIVCNLPVVVTCFYRHFRRMHAEDVYDYATDSSVRASLENTLDASAIAQTDLTYTAGPMSSVSTQSLGAFLSHNPK
ncbi:TauD-domain-containing protein [Athelia psychrophila]|uniref:TauD-domain-containing protein n=1 Tax=Athelia psychrophila TaxID=1759441 RepID=A0A166BLZ2_9AGAM|nr:TauD-domain-containing protein [Fibularhizoctonia sp. CBS 109695]